MAEIFYKKVGRKYVPVSEYDAEIRDALPIGSHLITVGGNGSATKFNVDPAFLPMIAAGVYARDAIARSIINGSVLRPSLAKLSVEQKELFNKYLLSLPEDERNYLSYGSTYDAVEAGVVQMVKLSSELLEHPSVMQAYEHFMLLCKLVSETEMS